MRKSQVARSAKVNEQAPATSGRFPRWSVLAIVAGVFAIGSDSLVISPLLADVATSLSSRAEQAALAVSVYGLAVGLTALLFSPIADRVPCRWLTIGGLGLFSLATLLCAMSPNLLVLLSARTIAGLGAGVFLPAAYTFVGNSVPYEHRARTMGIVMSGWGAALVLGVPFGAAIGQWLGWRWSFGSLAIIGTLAALALSRSLQVLPAKLVANRAVSNSRWNWSTELIAGLKVRRVPTLLGTTFLLMFGFYGMYTYLGSFLRESLKLGGSGAGSLIVMYGFGFSAGPLTGRFADQIGKQRALLLSLSGLVVLMALLPHLVVNVPIMGLALLIWGLLNSLAVTSLTALLSQCSTTYRGRILSLYSFATYLGLTLGSALCGQIWVKAGYSAVGLAGATAVALGAVLTLVTVVLQKLE